MCDYTQVNYKCGHQRYLVKAWCVVYQQTHQRCPPNVVAVDLRETRIDEYCGDCKDKTSSTASSQGGKKPDPDPKKGGTAPSTSTSQKSGEAKKTTGSKSS